MKHVKNLLYLALVLMVSAIEPAYSQQKKTNPTDATQKKKEQEFKKIIKLIDSVNKKEEKLFSALSFFSKVCLSDDSVIHVIAKDIEVLNINDSVKFKNIILRCNNFRRNYLKTMNKWDTLKVQIIEWQRLKTKTDSLIYNYPGYENHTELFSYVLKESEQEKVTLKMVSVVGNLYVKVSDDAIVLLQIFRHKK